jgi:hypothetical protein
MWHLLPLNRHHQKTSSNHWAKLLHNRADNRWRNSDHWIMSSINSRMYQGYNRFHVYQYNLLRKQKGVGLTKGSPKGTDLRCLGCKLVLLPRYLTPLSSAAAPQLQQRPQNNNQNWSHVHKHTRHLGINWTDVKLHKKFGPASFC